MTHAQQHEQYMRRCIDLARLGLVHVAPNPMVGAVLVHNGEIIGEGYHKQYGHAHAEVECVASVATDDQVLIPDSTLYVSLEPCNHFGKTPPCTNLILEKKIRRVVIGCRDPFPEVNGKGIARLREAGVEVIENILEKECRALNKRFFTQHVLHRPYVILKWAQSANGRIAAANDSRTFITNQSTNRLVHKWRSEEAAIMVGTNTALLDDPQLTTRLNPGKDPLRVVVDLDLRLPSTLKLFDKTVRTIVFNTKLHDDGEMLTFYQVTRDVELVHQVLNALSHYSIQSVIVEGGAKLLQSFIDDGSWDEARVITNTGMIIDNGIAAPVLGAAVVGETITVDSDQITYYFNPNNR
jgi:diaminohydroxyphosphoribosylaminopyrimidine deaminase / 5-amino-6-(5-phosphoribosylamino)uracil reductase